MDFVEIVASLTPVPYLSTAFTLLGYLYDSIEQAQSCKKQLGVLSQVVAGLLKALNERFLTGKPTDSEAGTLLVDLERLLEDINRFVTKILGQHFIKTVINRQDTITKIDGFYQRIKGLVQAFEISSALRVQDWQTGQDAAREADQRQLLEKLEALPKNDTRLMEALRVNQENMSAMMVFLMRQMKDSSSKDGPEYKFIAHALRRLSIVSGQTINVEDWMVTAYEVDRQDKIGSGGFADVYRATWQKTEVALKIVRTSGASVTPTSQAVLREIKLWLTLRHPNILPFLGANHLDSEPFIIMPFMPHGNASDFLQKNSGQSPLPIVTDAACGLLYLHSKDIVHGDVKAANILIDNAGTAVLSDFGLSRVKADMTVEQDTAALGPGSRNWMSPELLRGSLPRKPSDIYALGMTIYELFSREIPLGHILPQDLRSLVVGEDLRLRLQPFSFRLRRPVN
ncbi:kinase-like domain-containing protein [Mycena galopus ATCC 62051]|nr:kinase-like domain-containing protein [Mycena galopus ATCC 62051]